MLRPYFGAPPARGAAPLDHHRAFADGGHRPRGGAFGPADAAQSQDLVACCVAAFTELHLRAVRPGRVFGLPLLPYQSSGDVQPFCLGRAEGDHERWSAFRGRHKPRRCQPGPVV